MSKPIPTPLVQLHPRPHTLHVSQGRTVFESDASGWIRADQAHGLFVHQTRVLSRYQWLLNGQVPQTVAASSVQQHSFLGYYVHLPPEAATHAVDRGSGQMDEVSERTLELRISRFVGLGVHEDVDLTNYTSRPVHVRLALEVEGDFAGREELHLRRRIQHGRLRRAWRRAQDTAELTFRYTAEHAYSHQGERGVGRVDRAVRIVFDRLSSVPDFRRGRVEFRVHLQPGETWHACLNLWFNIDGKELAPQYQCRAFGETNTELDRKRRAFLGAATKFDLPESESLAVVAGDCLERAKADLASLRLHDLDTSEKHWTMAAGLPVYIALFGRDTLTAAWQAALCGPEMMAGTLRELARWQGTEVNDWRDEQPGRMLHEAHTEPLSVLGYNPRTRYYGAITTSAFYPVAVSELWHWTGNPDLIYPLLKPALDSIAWLDRYARHRDGFYYYQTRSEQGTRNQGWKDSPEAIVTPEDRLVRTPIATCEEQGFVYAAKLQMSEILWRFGRKDEARRFFREARDLKKRFNDVFWRPRLRFYALCLDDRGRPVDSIASNAGHCLATGIVTTERARAVADRLMAPDMFSGWGIRTLSSDHPSYNPYSYHRGSVWPVENGTFAMGFFRFGLWQHLDQLARALFEAAELYAHRRLPEVFAGHARDDDHPFPAIYPKANWPQAWSASAMFCILQAMLGLYPYASLDLLVLDPHLPEWLPEMTLTGLRVGSASADIRFRRERDGHTSYAVLEKRGRLRVLRQPSPWSVSATFGERLSDLLESVA